MHRTSGQLQVPDPGADWTPKLLKEAHPEEPWASQQLYGYSGHRNSLAPVQQNGKSGQGQNFPRHARHAPHNKRAARMAYSGEAMDPPLFGKKQRMIDRINPVGAQTSPHRFKVSVGVSGRKWATMPFSGDITAFIGRVPPEKRGTTGDMFILWNYKYHKLIVVNAIGLDNPQDEPDHRLTYLWLEKIQLLLNTIDFEHSDMSAYLLDRPTGPRLIQRARDHYRIPCDFLWAPRVDMRELEPTSLLALNHGYGQAIWRGQEVDFQIACDDLALRAMERETRALKALRGMDLTYELVAHIFMGDILYGVMNEPSRSARPLRQTDRATVFAAFAKLERAFMLHTGIIDDQRILMDKGRVRLLDIHDIRFYAPHQRKQLEQDAQRFHWESLNRLFKYMGPTCGFPAQFWKPETTILARTPTPERLLVIRGIDLRSPLLVEDEKTNRYRKEASKRTRGKAKTSNMGTMPPTAKQSSKAFSFVLSNLSRSIEKEAPPAYTEVPVTHGRIHSRLLMLAPEREDTFGASIVEVE
ncbi:hypothetical protein DFH06DRAFT_706258 [Mycena polygramma]|nr:hypothetical protein DFH06DRAFT_706258 [Mycena polygramma]